MVDDTDAARVPEGPTGWGVPLGWMATVASTEALATSGARAEDKEWLPAGQPGQGHEAKSLEEVYVFFLPIKESVIIDFFLVASLRDKVSKIIPL